MRDGSFFLICMLVLLGAVVILWLIKAVTRGGGGGSKTPQWRSDLGQDDTAARPFTPTVSGPGIALDDIHGWLWLATDEHGYMLVEKANVREWRHEWSEVNINRALELWHNRLVFRLADLTRPIVRVSFGRDHELAAQWQARLTIWLDG